jgi:hypothetical protein
LLAAPASALTILVAGVRAQTSTAGAAGSRQILFDGKDLSHWRGYKSDSVPDGWKVVDGALWKNTQVADLVTKDEFSDFELSIEWKIGEAGNSGIFYRGTEQEDHIYWTGPEYQLLDDEKAEDNKSRLTCAGAAYDLYCRRPTPETGGRVERDRISALGRTSSIGSTGRSCYMSCGAPTGKLSRRASSASIQITAAPRKVISLFREMNRRTVFPKHQGEGDRVDPFRSETLMKKVDPITGFRDCCTAAPS